MVILIPLLVAVVGVVVYALAGSPKVVELARIAFFAGLLVTLLDLAGAAIRLFPAAPR